MHKYFSQGCKYFYVQYFQGVVKSASEAVPTTLLGHTVTGWWEEGVHMCGVCDNDCDYRLNLYFHMLKQHSAPKKLQQTPVTAVTPGTIVKRGRGRPLKDGSVSSRASLESARAAPGPGLGSPAAAAAAPDTSATPATVTKWRNRVPPPYWVWGRYICEVGGTEKIKYGCVNSKIFLLSQ